MGGRRLVYGWLSLYHLSKKETNCLFDGLRSVGGLQVANVVFLYSQWVACALPVGGLCV